MKTCKALKLSWIFSEDLLEIYNFQIYKNLGEFDGALKIFKSLKEIKKPSGKFFRVWAKNQLRFEIGENFKIYIQKS